MNQFFVYVSFYTFIFAISTLVFPVYAADGIKMISEKVSDQVCYDPTKHIMIIFCIISNT